MEGVIIKLQLTNGYGFIKPAGGASWSDNIFFHRNDLVGLDFDECLLQLPVKFEVVERDDGKRAARFVQKAH